MYKALTIVTLRGELDRAVAGRFLRDAFVRLQQHRPCYVWVGWQNAIAALGHERFEISGERKRLIAAFIDSDVLGFDYFREGSQTRYGAP